MSDISQKETLISVVLPVYNEEEGLPQTIATLKEFIAHQPESYELIFVDDGSKDASAEILHQVIEQNQAFKMIQFSRNFGHQIAISAGIRYAKGDAVVVMDADLQDPPEVIPAMIKKWREGYEVVYGERLSREGESEFKKATAHAFYQILKRISSIDIPVDTGDFRLMSKRVVNVLSRMNESDPYVRGMVSWVGFKQCSVEYERAQRTAGTSKYPLSKMLKLATDGITSFSTIPLKISSWLGGTSIVIAFIYLVFALVGGFTSLNFLTFSLFLLAGVMMLTFGMAGTYLSRIFDSTRERPLYVVAQTDGFQVHKTDAISLKQQAHQG